MSPSRWRRSTHVMLAAAVIALVAVVVAVVAVFATGGNTSNAQVPAARPPATANRASSRFRTPRLRRPRPVWLAALAAPVADPNLGNVHRSHHRREVRRADLEQRAGAPMQPASTNKMLTSGAALLTLARDERVTTTVVAADQTRQPGVVVVAVATRSCRRPRPAPRPGIGARPHQRPRRPGTQERITVTAVQVDDSLSAVRISPRAGIRRTSPRRHRPDPGGDDRRRTHPTDHGRVATLHDPGSGRRSRAGHGAARGPRHRHVRGPARRPAASWRRCSPHR